MRFPESDLAALAAAEEVDIETRAADGTVHRTIVWVMVRDDVVYLRSYRGPTGRWYREALADPTVALHVDGRRLASSRRAGQGRGLGRGLQRRAARQVQSLILAGGHARPRTSCPRPCALVPA